MTSTAKSRLLFGAIALAAAVWTLGLYAGYSHSLTIGPWRISSRNPVRPLIVCAIAAAGYVVVSGRSGLRADLSRIRRGGYGVARTGAGGVRLIEAVVNPAAVAALIAVGSAATALAFRESTAGGADAFSYVTQADLWVSRTPGLRIEMPVAAAAPWPDAIGTFTPFGYRSTADRRAIVPVTAPGLPLLMAAFKKAAGHCAMFWVVPLTGGLLVWATFLIGARSGSPAVGLGAAWLIATSPTFLSMSKWVMSDVPAAAFWALATALILRRSTASALGAGASASAAILVRPNLLPIAGVLAGWMIWREFRLRSAGTRARLAALAAGMLPGLAATAAINHWLYGSAAASGYGDLGDLFKLHNFPLNVERYTRWLSATQTPLALAGVASLLVPWKRLWPTPESRAVARLLACVFGVVAAAYVLYTPFQDWWYLRFLLPAWPAIFIGTAALPIGLARGRAEWARMAAALLIIALGVRGIAMARALGVYPPGEGERRYATIAELVARVTEPSGVIVTTAHVGPVRYYAGRLTVRYDLLDPAWFDRALEWFARRGRRPYLLLEEHEVQEFTRRFGGSSRVAELEMAPALVYEAHRIGGRVFLFDPLNRSTDTWHPPPIVDPQPRCPAPAAAPPDYRGGSAGAEQLVRTASEYCPAARTGTAFAPLCPGEQRWVTK